MTSLANPKNQIKGALNHKLHIDYLGSHSIHRATSVPFQFIITSLLIHSKYITSLACKYATLWTVSCTLNKHNLLFLKKNAQYSPYIESTTSMGVPYSIYAVLLITVLFLCKYKPYFFPFKPCKCWRFNVLYLTVHYR
jgi:hypothetical protein